MLARLIEKLDLNIGWDQVVQHNGVNIAIVGMLIVFSGLTLISFSIAVLPRVLGLINGRPVRPSSKNLPQDRPDSEHEDVMAAIAFVVHAELERMQEDNQKVTVPLEPSRPSSWALSGRMRTLPR